MSILSSLTDYFLGPDPGAQVNAHGPNNPWQNEDGSYTPHGTGVGGYLQDQAAQAAPTPATTPTVDHTYDAWGGKAKYDGLVSGFNTQKQNIFGTASDAAASSGRDYGNSIQNFIGGLVSGQRGIDNQAIQNELSKVQGTRGVLGMVGRGIRSGGVMLANKNAGDSSATGALANAYGDLGRRQLSNVGNQYAQGQNAVDQAQLGFDEQRSSGVRNLQNSKIDVVNNIVTAARNSLAQLDAQIASASLPDRINLEQAKEQVRNDALGQLQQHDAELTGGAAGVQASSGDTRRSEGMRLANAGTAPDTAFNYTDQVPAQFQGTGPFGSDLPLFTFRGRRQA